eukprot:COSAG01_NODE_23_length_37704_cov_30.005877_31_plen_553_part_00
MSTTFQGYGFKFAGGKKGGGTSVAGAVRKKDHRFFRLVVSELRYWPSLKDVASAPSGSVDVAGATVERRGAEGLVIRTDERDLEIDFSGVYPDVDAWLQALAAPSEGVPTLIVKTDAARQFGAPLGEVLAALGNAKIALVSAPEFGPGPRAGQFQVPVMTTLEHAASACFPTLVTAYDYKGSSSANDCAARQPDRDMTARDWVNPDAIEDAQWCRYWSGRVRATLATLLLGATPLPGTVRLKSCQLFANGQPRGFTCGATERVTFAFSIGGGPITQTEYRLLGELLPTTVADLSTRELDLGADVSIFWLHFDTVEDCLKALQGYGGIDTSAIFNSMKFGQPGRWTDGPYNAAFDLLRGVPGSTPEKRRAHLSQGAAVPVEQLNHRLHAAIGAGSAGRAQQLLAAKADPNCVSGGSHPALHKAAARADPALVRALLEAGADPRAVDQSARVTTHARALPHAQGAFGAIARDAAGVVQGRIDATVALLLPSFQALCGDDEYSADSPWWRLENGGRAYYYNEVTKATTLDAPAEGVRDVREKDQAAFETSYSSLV